jgi:N-acetylmuramoyl-L-alanine amidase
VKDIVARYNIPATNIGTFRYCTYKKTGSGTFVSMEKLYDEYQIGMWYDDAAKQTFLSGTGRFYNKI